MLKPEWFKTHESHCTHINSLHTIVTSALHDLLDRIETKTREKRMKEQDGWKIEEGILKKEGKILVPDDEKIIEEVIRQHHDEPIAGHPGIQKTIDLISRSYFWQNLSSDVKKYVQGCIVCQQIKSNTQPRRNPLHPHSSPSAPWEEISVDLIGPLPESNGHDAILVIVDRFSKMIKAIPSSLSLTSLGFAKILCDFVFRHHGMPKKIISDRGPQFASRFLKEFSKLIGIQQNLSTAYHPQTDGQTKRINQELEKFLCVFVNYRQDDWAEWLTLAEFSYNNHTHSTTKQTPFFLNQGQHPNTPFTTFISSNNESAQNFTDRMKTIFKNVKE